MSCAEILAKAEKQYAEYKQAMANLKNAQKNNTTSLFSQKHSAASPGRGPESASPTPKAANASANDKDDEDDEDDDDSTNVEWSQENDDDEPRRAEAAQPVGMVAIVVDTNVLNKFLHPEISVFSDIVSSLSQSRDTPEKLTVVNIPNSIDNPGRKAIEWVMTNPEAFGVIFMVIEPWLVMEELQPLLCGTEEQETCKITKITSNITNPNPSESKNWQGVYLWDQKTVPGMPMPIENMDAVALYNIWIKALYDSHTHFSPLINDTLYGDNSVAQVAIAKMLVDNEADQRDPITINNFDSELVKVIGKSEENFKKAVSEDLKLLHLTKDHIKQLTTSNFDFNEFKNVLQGIFIGEEEGDDVVRSKVLLKFDPVFTNAIQWLITQYHFGVHLMNANVPEGLDMAHTALYNIYNPEEFLSRNFEAIKANVPKYSLPPDSEIPLFSKFMKIVLSRQLWAAIAYGQHAEFNRYVHWYVNVAFSAGGGRKCRRRRLIAKSKNYPHGPRTTIG